jgi:ATP-dependent exoDNAse (exonuclease V) beta subunit
VRIRIITASAGSGKTTRLSEILDDAIGGGRARPAGIIATTFTKQAAAELVERARSRLLASGRGRQAHQLLAARIGTVNAVCGSLVTDYAFELGLSPRLGVLDEAAAEVELKRALAAVVSDETAGVLQTFQGLFDKSLDWHYEVGRLIEAARANGITPEGLRACAERSSATLDECLGPIAADGETLDGALLSALEGALAAIDTSVDTTKGTGTYVDLLRECRHAHLRAELRWGDWAKLLKEKPKKKSEPHALPVSQAAAAHLAHPRLRADMHRLIRLVFDVAALAMVAYQAHKRELGVIDFVDQETLALELLRRADVRADLLDQLDLVLVDEFQDTSPLQLAIFLTLAELAEESVWVGDPKQAIYSFRGTDPALMDAAIESLTSPAHDPELVNLAVQELSRAGKVETLGVSYRSRPELVALTSDIFARAFASQGMPEERTRLVPASPVEPEGLGPIVEHWPLYPGAPNKDTLAACAAAGVRDLLAGATSVRDRASGAARAARAGDVAVLCRTNEQCRKVADALLDLGVPAVVPRAGLLDTPEGQLAVAGLRLWVDPRDGLAAATLARLTTYAGGLDALLARALAAPGCGAFAGEPVVERILAARAAAPDLGAVAALSAVIDAADLRGCCAAWGRAEQRLANLDALRAHAVTYVAEAAAAGDAPTVVGLLGRLDELVDTWGWNAVRTDRQALLGGDDAVTLSTWHRAKGLEWPLTVLYGLETLRPPLAYGVHVLSDQHAFDVRDPLAGRWVRFWPNPYSTSNQLGPVKEAYEQSPTFRALAERNRREALRVLYVGWTRARDRLILAAQDGKLTAGLVGTLSDIDPTLIDDSKLNVALDRQVRWAGRDVTLRVRPAEPASPVQLALEPGAVTLGRPPAQHPPARVLPSAAAAVVCQVGAPLEIGPRLAIRGAPSMELVGQTMHAFFAADRPDAEERVRLDMAQGLLRRYGLEAHLDAADVTAAGARLWSWLQDVLGATHCHREWPVAERLASGSVVGGTADLVACTAGGFALIDHKTFPGTLAAALERLPRYSGQLAAYVRAITAATGTPVTSAWIHLPVLGTVVELQGCAPSASGAGVR